MVVGNDKIKALALPMKSTLEALQLMNKVINNFEDALDLKADDEKRAMMARASGAVKGRCRCAAIQ